MVQQRGLAEGAKAPLSCQRAEKAAEDGEKIIMQIDREGETVGLMSVPLYTFVGGYPFASSGFNDGESDYFAQESSGILVIADVWKRGGDRTNSNFVIMGNSDVGKSTAIKHIIMSDYMKGTKILVADPESEYKDLCFQLGGDWINAFGGSNGMINPLQVRPSPCDDEAEKESDRLYRDEGYGMNDLALHMKNQY